MNIELHQICYSNEFLDKIPTGFHVLNNLSNKRPDWREYWPIRNYLLNNELKDGCLYGFFSPKFALKTQLNYSDICKFINDKYNNEDLITFSPFWDLSAFFINSFEQGDFFQPGLMNTSQQIFSKINNRINLLEIISDFESTCFCNYFIAKKEFWNEWLSIGEYLFNESENINSASSDALNTNTLYGNQNLPMKIFIQERLVDYVLLSDNSFRALCYDTLSLPTSITPINIYKEDLIVCNSLKSSYKKTGNNRYLDIFNLIRKKISNHVIATHPQHAQYFKRFL